MDDMTEAEVKELEQYFRTMAKLFRSDGWKEVIKQLEQLRISWSDIDRLDTETQLFTAKGALIVINTLLSLEAVTAQTAEDYPDA